ncbi:MAG TPA: monovalent cation/H+ antiporter complex subunit F [Candidatus Binatia bacterium]|jgi:multisubunit Na+/H+ antiporter MnhF subunit|nr:monovalent cation/H+ antiporter complex subunit F [Candidatus Binatia bacterium]
MLAAVTSVAMAGLGISLALCLWRLVVGPDVVDRLLALDTITVNVVALLVVLSIHLRTDVYLEAVIVLALLGFVGTVAVAKALMRGRIID